MVKRSILFVVVFVLAVASMSIGVASAQRVFNFDHQWAQLFINQDGTVDLTYNVTVTLSSGDPINFVRLGQPNGDFTVGEAVDQFGRQLQATDDSSGSNYRVRVDLAEPLTAGNTVWFTVTTNVARMIFNDTTNPGNYGMQFAPQWLQDVPINDVRIQIVLPPDVTVDEVKTTEVFYNSTSIVEGRLAVYWEKPVLQPNEIFLVGVSFPAPYLPDFTPPPDGGFGELEGYMVLFLLAGLVIVVLAVIIFLATRKSSYSTPRVSMETLGIKRGLTAVEASYLLDLKPPQIVTAILYSLLQKRAVWAEETKPSLKLRVLPPYENKTGTKEFPLRYYEIDFLRALRADGSLDEEKLARAIMFLRDTVEQKMHGYSRKDTVDYYVKIVSQAWSQVEQAGTVELASNAYDEQLLWLMLDPNQRTRTETVFRDRTFEPNPLWFWWWYSYSTYNPRPTYKPNINVPTQSGKPPSIPGGQFADNIATAVEITSNNIVVSLEKFANAIVPPPPKASHKPARAGADCVCACAACACACACVSCACACAGGGVG